MKPSASLVLGAIACRSISAGRHQAAFMGCCFPTKCSRFARTMADGQQKKPHLLDPSSSAYGAAARKKRRLIEALSFAPSSDDNLQTPHKIQKKRRRNRPGFNSYLKVLLDDSTLQLLRNTTLDIQKMIEKGGDEQEQAATPAKSNTEVSTVDDQVINLVLYPSSDGNRKPSPPSPPPLRLKPRSLNSLHMTFFFGGEVLCELSPEDLTAWYEQIAKRIRQSFPSDELRSYFSSPQPEASYANDYWFRLQEICLFPPRRRNLLVATLEASPAWHALHDDIRAIALRDDSPEPLRNLVQSSSFQQWKPHITLANIRTSGPRSSQRAQADYLSEILQEVELPIEATLKANGITIGGPVPEQAETLDWNFPTA